MDKIKNEWENEQEINDSNKHLFPKDIKEAYEFLKENEGKILFPEKYFKSQNRDLKEHLKALFQNHPNLEMRDVIINTLQKLPTNLETSVLLDRIGFISNEWERLTSKQKAA